MLADTDDVLHDGHVALKLFAYAGELGRFEADVPADVAQGVLNDGVEDGFALVLLAERHVGLADGDGAVVKRDVDGREHLHGLVRYGQRLVAFAFADEGLGQLAEDVHTVALAHAHRVLLEVNTGLVGTAPLEAVHDVVVHLFRVDRAGTLGTCREGHEAVGQAGLLEVGVEADELVRVDGDGEVDGALPVVGHHHVEDGDGFLTDGLLAGEVDEELSGHHRGVLRIDGVVLAHSIGVDRVDELLGRQIVDRLIDAGDGLRTWVVAAEPLEGLIEIHLLHALDEVGVVAGALNVLGARPGDGQRIGVVSLTLHLIRVPVCLQVAGVADAHIGADAFHLLGIPKREGVVVAVGEDHGVRLARLEVVGAKVAAHVAARAVVVVPVLSGHL